MLGGKFISAQSMFRKETQRRWRWQEFLLGNLRRKTTLKNSRLNPLARNTIATIHSPHRGAPRARAPSANFPHVDAQGQQIPVAQYLRMSTEHQQYSIENQQAAIAQFACANGMEIIQTFKDSGRSGLSLRGRPGLQELLRDILSPQRSYECVVVYDVSRWGRFQDIDESAFYEHICRRAGVRILYCAESFDDVPGPMGVVIKSVKRAMAAEYSRELSAKVYASMMSLARRGYHMGGPAGFGLKRVQVAANGAHQRDLPAGERKSRTCDHVELAPGDPIDCGLVRLIFFLCVHCGLKDREIAMQLNWSCYPSQHGLMPWRSQVVRALLRNEKYVGTAVYGSRTQRLHSSLKHVQESDWIRSAHSFEPIVSLQDFNAARTLVGDRKKRRKWTNAELLEIIREFNVTRGYFDGSMLRGLVGGPSSQVYLARFGSLTNACKAANVELTKRMNMCLRRQKQRCAQKLRTIAWLAEHFRGLGRTFYCHPPSSRVCIDGLLKVCIRVLHPQRDHGSIRWTFHSNQKTKPDVSIFLRVTDEDELLDYFVVPGSEAQNGWINRRGLTTSWLEQYRCKTRAEVITRLESARPLTQTFVPQMHLAAEARRRRRAELNPPQREPRFVLSVKNRP